MEPTTELYHPLVFDFADPEDPQSKATPMKFDEPRPKTGYEFIPAHGTIPRVLDKEDNLKIYDEQGCRYKGETNAEGRKHGKGKCTYIDGSTYDGSWLDGFKSGYGILTKKEGITYKGFFEKDLKQGQGEIYYPNGDIIKTTWDNDRKHGRGIVIKKRGKQHDVVFYNDLEMDLSEQNPECFDLMPLNLFIVICTVISIFFAWHYNDIRVDLVVLTIYIINIIDTACSRTHQMIYRMISSTELSRYINRIRVRPPVILFKLQNYHNEQIERKTEDGSVQFFDQRIDTEFITDVYRFSEWIDQSPDINDINNIKRTLFSKLTFILVINGTSQANQSFKCQEYTFKRTHFRDDFFEYNFERSIDDFQKELIVYHTASGKKPWFANLFVYWAFSLLLLGWLHRIIMYINYKKISFDATKLIAK